MKPILMIITSVSLGLSAILTGASCSTAPKTESGRTDIVQDANEAIATARQTDPSIVDLLSDSAGYAVFPTVGKGAIGIGGAYGKGVLYEDGSPVGYCDLTQATVGLQLGGQSYTEIIAFEKDVDIQRFKEGNLRFSAQATAVALESGASANAAFKDGVAVFTMAEAGLMFEASVGGQKFSYQAN